MIIVIFVFSIFISIFNGNAEIYEKNIDDIKDPDLKFVVIGDPHIGDKKSNDSGTKRLIAIVDTINNMDIDFVVILGDITDKGIREQYKLSKNILDKLEKPYYVIIGNHDIMKSDKTFEKYYGTPEKIEIVKGRKDRDYNNNNDYNNYGNDNDNIYQLLFIGTYGDRDNKGEITNLYWSFDFEKANKTIPTLIFSHTPIRCPGTVYVTCKLDERHLIYGKDMEDELNKFDNLLGVYSGHIHRDSDEIRNGVRYVTVNGLISMGIANIYAEKSDHIGYSVIKDGVLYYQLKKYN